MTKHMLIDSTHQEETRVVVVDGQRLEEFDVETAQKKPLKGNIYLAKIVRVEPSLQAAFVDYGGNRHGFLAFNEIHPDYYRIPIADREALIAEEARAFREQDERDEPDTRRRRRSRPAEDAGAQAAGTDESDAEHPGDSDDHDDGHDHGDDRDHDGDDHVGDDLHGDDLHGDEDGHDDGDEHDDHEELGEDDDHDDNGDGEDGEANDGAAGNGDDALHAEPALSGLEPDTGSAVYDGPDADFAGGTGSDDNESEESLAGDQAMALRRGTDDPILAKAADSLSDSGDIADPVPLDDGAAKQPSIPIETLGGDEIDEAKQRRRVFQRRYKIQEVIKRRQIMLVQVTKEERGTKGAALTTYLSLAGRYCVLMPNTGRGGGISRKISSPGDRKRLKSVLDELGIPDGMSVIVRTAGSERTKAEIRRDCDYLLRLWDGIRDQTLKSTAPSLIHEEANLIKRSIRDLYSRDIDDVIVEGDEGYKAAKSFMRMLMPSHAKRVQQYKDPKIPLFQRYHVESQLDAIHTPVVQLKSGGYIVLNQTEALVSIDVNSGRATRERHIEETALKTNLEASAEIARQLRLRDLAGLIVIDFIDMEEQRHNNAVERKVKEAMRQDRARIQIGRISPFGLLELSRQRLRPSLVEASTEICRHCRGVGHVRSTESTALHILRSIEEEAIRKPAPGFNISAPTAVALYVLNQKRRALADIEQRHGLRIYFNGNDTLIPPDYLLERLKELLPGEQVPVPAAAPAAAAVEIEEDDDIAVPDDEDDEIETEAAERTEQPTGEREPRGRRRRGRRRGRGGDDRSARDRTSQPERVEGDDAQPVAAIADDDRENSINAEASAGHGDQDDDKPKRRRRRGRRGGRRRRGRQTEDGGTGEAPTSIDAASENEDAAAASSAPRPVVPSPADFRFAGDADLSGINDDGSEDDDDDAAVATSANAAATSDRGPADDLFDDGDETGVPSVAARNSDGNMPTESVSIEVELADEQPIAASGNDGSHSSADIDAGNTPATQDEPVAEPKRSEPRRGGWWQRRDS